MFRSLTKFFQGNIENQRISCFEKMMENQKKVLALQDSETKEKDKETLAKDYKIFYEQCKDTIAVKEPH
jgi:hypothetical protein